MTMFARIVEFFAAQEVFVDVVEQIEILYVGEEEISEKSVCKLGFSDVAEVDGDSSCVSTVFVNQPSESFYSDGLERDVNCMLTEIDALMSSVLVDSVALEKVKPLDLASVDCEMVLSYSEFSLVRPGVSGKFLVDGRELADLDLAVDIFNERCLYEDRVVDLRLDTFGAITVSSRHLEFSDLKGVTHVCSDSLFSVLPCDAFRVPTRFFQRAAMECVAGADLLLVGGECDSLLTSKELVQLLRVVSTLRVLVSAHVKGSGLFMLLEKSQGVLKSTELTLAFNVGDDVGVPLCTEADLTTMRDFSLGECLSYFDAYRVFCARGLHTLHVVRMKLVDGFIERHLSRLTFEDLEMVDLVWGREPDLLLRCSARFLCEDYFKVNPIDAVSGRDVTMLNFGGLDIGLSVDDLCHLLTVTTSFKVVSVNPRDYFGFWSPLRLTRDSSSGVISNLPGVLQLLGNYVSGRWYGVATVLEYNLLRHFGCREVILRDRGFCSFCSSSVRSLWFVSITLSVCGLALYPLGLGATYDGRCCHAAL